MSLSVPDRIFQKAERLSQQLGISRSKLYTKALEHFLNQQVDTRLAGNFNKVYGELDSSLDPGLRSAARKTFKGGEW